MSFSGAKCCKKKKHVQIQQLANLKYINFFFNLGKDININSEC